MAMTVVPVAANATDITAESPATAGPIIPNVVSFDNNAKDLDGKATNGIIKWYQGDVTLAVNQPLVAGKYVFRAHLMTSAVGVYVKIAKAGVDELQPIAAGDAGKDYTQYVQANGRDIEVKFELESDEADGVEIVISPVTSFQQADNKYFFISDQLDDPNAQAGLVFSAENFADANTAINNAINNFVNKTVDYDSENAQLVMTAAKELVQRITANPETMTYESFLEYELNADPITDSKLYKEVAQLFNQATRLEAEYQANKLLKQLEDAKEAVLDPDGDGEPDLDETSNEYQILDEMAQSIENAIADYKETAGEETDATIDPTAENGVTGGFETPVEFDEDFDVDPEYSPLKDIADAVSSLLPNEQGQYTGKAGQLYEALVVSYDANDAASEQIQEMMDEIDESFPGKGTAYNTAAQAIITYYRDILDATKAEILAKPIAEMDNAFVTKMKAQLTVADNNVAVDGDNLIKPFKTIVYDQFDAALAALNNGVDLEELTDEAEARIEAGETPGFGTKYADMENAYAALLAAAGAKIVWPALTTIGTDKINLKKADGTNLETTDYAKLKDNTGYNTANAKVDANFVSDFNAYVVGLNELDKVYAEVEAADKEISKRLENNCPNESNYDARNFFKEVYHNQYYNIKNGKVLGDTTYVNKPGTAVVANDEGQDNTVYVPIKNYLNKLAGQLNEMWGTYAAATSTTPAAYTAKEGTKKLKDYAAFTPGEQEYTLTGRFFETLKEFVQKFEKAQNYDYQNRTQNNNTQFMRTERMLNFYVEVVDSLAKKVKGMNIYDANPKMFYTGAENEYKDENDALTLEYVHPSIGEEADKVYLTYKRIVTDLQTQVKDLQKQFTEVLNANDPENYDNSSTLKHYAKLTAMRTTLLALFNTANENIGEQGQKITVDSPLELTTADANAILSMIGDFVRDGGILDQQEALYEEMVPADNYDKLAEQLAGKTTATEEDPETQEVRLAPTTGMIKDLTDRISADQIGEFGDDGVNGYYADTNEDGKPDYFVGYDMDGEDGITVDPDELVNLSQLKVVQSTLSPEYGSNVEPLPDDAIILNKNAQEKYIDLIAAFNQKLKEAEAIYMKWFVNIPKTEGKPQKSTWNAETQTWTKIEGEGGGDWTREDYQKANAEFGQAATIIKEVNAKLKAELEQPMIPDIQAVLEINDIRTNVLDKMADAVDPQPEPGVAPSRRFMLPDPNEQEEAATYDPQYQVATTNFLKFDYMEWTNAKNGLNHRTMAEDAPEIGENLAEIAELLIGHEEGEKWNAAYAKALAKLNVRDQALATKLHEIYDDVMALRTAVDQSFLTKNVKAQWNSANKAKWQQVEKKIVDFVNLAAKEQERLEKNITALYDLMSSFNYDNDYAEVNPTGAAQYDFFDLFKASEDLAAGNELTLEDFENDFTAEIRAKFKAWLQSGDMTLQDLLQTSGYLAIEKNDNAAESADDLLEPVVVDEEGVAWNQHSYKKALADPKTLAKIEATAFEAVAARALRTEAAATGGVLYEKALDFLTRLNAAMANRTLNDNYDEFQEEFETLAQLILNVDQHAAANKEQNEEMHKAIDALESSIDAEIAKLEAQNEADPSVALTKGITDLKNVKARDVATFETDVDDDYVKGIAWMDGSLGTPDIVKREVDALGELQKKVNEIIAKANGTDPSQYIAVNNEAWEDFNEDYSVATQEFNDLVKKLDQLKNLDSDVPAALKTEAKTTADAVNTFLFGKADPTDPDEGATENAKDKLDRAYKEGTAAKNLANDPENPKPWSSVYQTELNGVKEQIEAYIEDVDDIIDDAIDYWDIDTSKVWNAAKTALETYSCYWSVWKPIQAMKESNEAEQKAKADAEAGAIIKIINDNADFKYLRNTANAIVKKIDDLKDEDNLITRNEGDADEITYYGKKFDINDLFDAIKVLSNADERLADGQNAEAKKDIDTYKNYASAHLQSHKTAFDLNNIPYDYEIAGTEVTLKGLEDEYKELTLDKEGKAKEVTTGTYLTFKNGIEGLFGKKELVADKTDGSYKWNTDAAKCNALHQFIQNISDENQLANLAIIGSLETSLKAAADSIAKFQVAPRYATEILGYAGNLALMKKLITSSALIESTADITGTVEGLKATYGTVNTLGFKKIEEFANVIGTMDAEAGILPDLLARAWNAERTRLEQDINEMRGEFKTYTGSDADAVNQAIEDLWSAVQAAKIGKGTTEKSGKDADGKDIKKNEFTGWNPTSLVDIQNQIKALYKKLRDANETAEPFNAQDGLARLDAAKAAGEDAYANEDPNVKEKQAQLDYLYAYAKSAIQAAQAANALDYQREKLEEWVQKVEEKQAERDAVATQIAAVKKQALDAITAANGLIAASKKAVNSWDEEAPALADNKDSEESYEDAQDYIDAYVAAIQDIIDDHDYTYDPVNGYTFADPKEKNEDEIDESLFGNAVEAIAAAENAAADYDLLGRLSKITRALSVINSNNEAGLYSEDEEFQTELNDAMEALAGKTTDLYNDIMESTTVTGGFITAFGADYGVDNFEELLSKILGYTPEEGDYVKGLEDLLEELQELVALEVIGDMNGDGKVTLADASWIFDIAMDKRPMPVIGSDEFTKADVNGDGSIDIADATAAVNLFFYGNIYGPEDDEVLARSSQKESLDVKVMKTEDGYTRLAISLDNARQYTAFQMDLQLAGGMKLAAASLSERGAKQFVETSENDGVLRVGAMSIRNDAFTGNSGDVLYLDFEVAAGAEDNFARFNDVFFVTKNGQKVSFNLGGITPTGIQSANAETALGQKFYDLGGRMKNSLKKGINIIKDAAGNAKKVIVK